MAEDEARRISEWTKAALVGVPRLTAALGARGGGVGPSAPGADAAYVDLAAMLAEIRAIAARINGEGYTTRGGRPWNPLQVARVMGRAGSLDL